MKNSVAELLSQSHIEAAFFFAEMASKIEENRSDNKYFQRVTHHSFVQSSIVSSACALEAFINEWYSQFGREKGDNSEDEELIAALWQQGIPRTASYPILKKYQIALMLSKKEQFDESMEPFQSVSSLIKLRNALVHFEPTFEPPEHPDYKGDDKPHALAKHLRGKFPLNPLVTEWAPLWTLKLLGSGCANWAAGSALRFMNEFVHKIDEGSSDLTYDKVREFAHSDEWSRILTKVPKRNNM